MSAICPSCGQPGSGGRDGKGYRRRVKGAGAKPSWAHYFAHRVKRDGKWSVRWCYLGSGYKLKPKKPRRSHRDLLVTLFRYAGPKNTLRGIAQEENVSERTLQRLATWWIGRGMLVPTRYPVQTYGRRVKHRVYLRTRKARGLLYRLHHAEPGFDPAAKTFQVSPGLVGRLIDSLGQPEKRVADS